MAKIKITWTEIAIQLTGYVPTSCKLLEDGRMVVKLQRGKNIDTIYFPKKEVEAARKELEEIAAPTDAETAASIDAEPAAKPAAKPPAEPKAKQPAKAPTKPPTKRGRKPKEGAK